MGIIQKNTFSIDNEIIDNSEKIANEFNNFFFLLLFYKEEFLLRKFSKKQYIYIYNIVITVELQMGHTLYIIKIIVSIMNH